MSEKDLDRTVNSFHSQLGLLYLESGKIFEGLSVLEFETAGEVVFNTSHSGYEEVFSDPSYYNQIVVMTAPMQGNYGLPHGEKAYQSQKFWASGLVCLNLQKSKSNRQWYDVLKSRQKSVLSEADTREIVLEIREKGETYGALVQKTGDWKTRAVEMIDNIKRSCPGNWPNEVSSKGCTLFGQEFDFKIAVVDFGCKSGLLKQMLRRASEVRVFNSKSSARQILDWRPDMVLLSNGPGDPGKVKEGFFLVKDLLGKTPLLGVCMGHQLLSRAMGAKVYKMYFGHHGANHPIQDHLLNQIYISSQNHGYAVDESSLKGTGLKVSHRNLIDQTVAGVFSEEKKCLGVQMHPESSPGPHEAEALIDYFIKTIVNKKGGR